MGCRGVIVLDTHVAVWYASGAKIKVRALRVIHDHAERGALGISAISAWEIGMLARKGRLVIERETVAAYVDAMFGTDGVDELPVTAKIAELAARLPGDFHGDPADRLIVATAVAHHATLVTRDERILTYGRATSFVSVLAA